MRWAAAALIASSLALAASHAQAEDAPLFAVFKTFCIDTHGQLDPLRAALQSAGGKLVDPSPVVTKVEDSTITTTIWEVSVLGRDYRVSFVDLRSGFETAQGRYSEDCGVETVLDDEASLVAARRWIGIPPSHAYSNVMDMELYDFQQSGDQIAPLPDDADAFKKLELSGRVWALSLQRSPKGTNLDLQHSMPPPAKP